MSLDESAADRLTRRLSSMNNTVVETSMNTLGTAEEGRKYVVSGTIGMKGSGKGEFFAPISVCTLLSGTLVASDCLNHRVQILHRDGFFVIGEGQDEESEETFTCPHGLCYMPDTKTIAVADEDNHRIVIVHPTGKFVKIIDNGRGKLANQFNNPTGVCCVRSTGHLAVCDSGSKSSTQNRTSLWVALEGPNSTSTGRGASAKWSTVTSPSLTDVRTAYRYWIKMVCWCAGSGPLVPATDSSTAPRAYACSAPATSLSSTPAITAWSFCALKTASSCRLSEDKGFSTPCLGQGRG